MTTRALGHGKRMMEMIMHKNVPYESTFNMQKEDNGKIKRLEIPEISVPVLPPSK